MAKDKNSKQPISNQAEDDVSAIDWDAIYPEQEPEYQEIFDFLEHELGMPCLDERQKYILGRAINEAIKAYRSIHLSNLKRHKVFTELSKGLKKASGQLKEFFGDGELTHVFFRLSGWRFEQMHDFQQWMREAYKTLQRMESEGIARKPEKAEGAPTKIGLHMLIYHLCDGWKDAFDQSPLDAATPKKEEITYFGEEIVMGDRGNLFAYFVWSVHRQAEGKMYSVGYYGRSVRSIVINLEGICDELGQYTTDEVVAELTSDENLVDKTETEINVGENK